MLGVNQLDFINYTTALKGNYRKGVHKLRAILTNPAQAAEFAANLGGVCVVLGVPIGQDDRNSQQLLSMLLASNVVDQATLTWVSQWYPDYADDWDTIASDSTRASEIFGNDLIWRAVGASPVGAGKVLANIAGLDCRDYDNVAALVTSPTGIEAVINNDQVLNVVMTSSAAMAAMAASQAAMEVVAASQKAMAAVTASPIAMASIWQNETALTAVQNNEEAWATFTGVSSEVIGKTAAILAGLDPAYYADMAAVAASSTAMMAVIASDIAMSAISSTGSSKTFWSSHFGDKAHFEVYNYKNVYGESLYAYCNTTTPSKTGYYARPTVLYGTKSGANEPWGSPGDNYNARQTYYVFTPEAISVTGNIQADDGSAFYLNGSMFHGESSVVPSTSKTLSLVAGWNKFELAWNEGSGDAGCIFVCNWSSMNVVTLPTITDFDWITGA